MDESIRQRVHDFLAHKGMRKTVQRDAIVTAAFSTHEHYSAEELLKMSQKIERSVSRATVYRTLPLLVECGVLAANRGVCPLTIVAAGYTGQRTPNFDIYLPVWLARYNKTIFGVLFVIGGVFAFWRWWTS